MHEIKKLNISKLITVYYSELSQLSSQMLVAAQEGYWDFVSEHEIKCAEIIEKLKTLPSASELTDLSDSERQIQLTLLNKIIKEDNEIRLLAQPWLRALEQELKISSNQKRISNNYSQM